MYKDFTTPRHRCRQWRGKVWWCPGRLLDRMPLYRIPMFNSGVWWSLLLDIRCFDVTLWRHIHVCNQRFGEVCWHNMYI